MPASARSALPEEARAPDRRPGRRGTAPTRPTDREAFVPRRARQHRVWTAAAGTGPSSLPASPPRAVAEHSPIAQRQLLQQPARLATAQRVEDDGNFVTDF